MKINYKDVINYIEKEQGIQLYDFQKKALKTIIENKNIFLPRQAGMSMLLNGLGEYLIKISKNPESYDAGKYDAFEYDEIITLDEVMSDMSNVSKEQALSVKDLWRKIKSKNKEMFLQEFDISNQFKG